MPKTKKLEDSDSGSDSSGPSDRNPPPSKKSKSEPAKSGSSKSKKDEDMWNLDGKRAVKINEFRGRIFVDIREYYENDGELKPGKKGISLSAVQYQKLKDIIPEIDEALKKY